MLLDSDMNYLYLQDSNSISYLKRTDINAELPQPAHIDMIIVITRGKNATMQKRAVPIILDRVKRRTKMKIVLSCFQELLERMNRMSISE